MRHLHGVSGAFFLSPMGLMGLMRLMSLIGLMGLPMMLPYLPLNFLQSFQPSIMPSMMPMLVFTICPPPPRKPVGCEGLWKSSFHSVAALCLSALIIPLSSSFRCLSSSRELYFGDGKF